MAPPPRPENAPSHGTRPWYEGGLRGGADPAYGRCEGRKKHERRRRSDGGEEARLPARGVILADRMSWIATAGAASPEEWNDDPRLMVSALETMPLVLGSGGCGKGGDATAFRKHVGRYVDEGMGCLVPTHDGTRYDGAVPARYSGSAG